MGHSYKNSHSYGTHWKTVMGQGIFKAVYGHFLNNFGTQMKIWTFRNILNTYIAQMNSIFNTIIPFQNFMFLYLTFYKKSCKKSTFLKFFSGFCVFICIKLFILRWKLLNLLKNIEKSIKSILISRKNEFVP